MKNSNEIGIVHEVGDLGLGFELLSKDDKNKLKKDKKINK